MLLNSQIGFGHLHQLRRTNRVTKIANPRRNVTVPFDVGATLTYSEAIMEGHSMGIVHCPFGVPRPGRQAIYYCSTVIRTERYRLERV